MLRTDTPLLPLCLLLLAGLLLGCGNRRPLTPVINRAEALMEDHPDSAYALLRTIDSTSLAPGEEQARYALLYTQARDKNYIVQTDDSLIQVAVRYFRKHGSMRHRFLSLFYHGRVLTDSGSKLQAMRCYMEAEGLLSQFQDDYYAGLLYTQLGDSYENFYDFTHALAAFQKAELHYQQAGKELHRLYALVNQSTIHRNLNNYVQSDSLLQLVVAGAEEMANQRLAAIAIGSLVMQYVEQNRMEEAKLMYTLLLDKYGVKRNSAAFFTSVIRIYLAEGDIDTALSLQQQAWQRAKSVSDSISCYVSSSCIYQAMQQPHLALQEQTKGVQMQNRLTTQNLQQPIADIQRDYLTQELHYQKYRQKVLRLIYILSVVIIGLILLLIGYVWQKRWRRSYRIRLRNHWKRQETAFQQRLKQFVSEANLRENTIRQDLNILGNQLAQQDESYRNHIARLQEEIWQQNKNYTHFQQDMQYVLERNRQLCDSLPRLFRSKLLLFDQWLKVYYDYYRTEKSKLSALEKACIAMFNSYFRSKRGYALLEQEVNEYYDNVMVHFRKDVILMDEEAYRQVCLHIAGISVKSIAYLLDATPNAIYKRRNRIIEAIKKEEKEHAEWYISLINL